MIIIQEEYPLRNGSASTSDWIGQVEGGIIYAYDLSGLSLEEQEIIDKLDNQKVVRETVQKYKARFKEAWEELSDR